MTRVLVTRNLQKPTMYLKPKFVSLSPQRYLREQGQGKFLITPETSVFTFPQSANATLTFKMSDNCACWADLPIAYVVSPPTLKETAADSAYLNLTILDPANVNLTNAQKELMLWHFKLGHFHLEWVQKLFRVREGENEPTLSSCHKVNACQLPQCAACHYAKMHLRPTDSITEKKVIKKD
jgi:GAG-pre-integrase domain